MSERDGDERQHDLVEKELEDWLNAEFGATRGDLGLSPEQQAVADANASAALARILTTPRSAAPTPIGSPRPGPRRPSPGVWLAAAAATVALLVVVVGWPGSPSPTAYASTPPLLEVHRGVGAADYPLTTTDAAPHLRRLARLASRQPAPGTGEVDRTLRVGWWLDVDAADPDRRRVVPVVTETLQLRDATRVRVRRGDPLTTGGGLDVAPPSDVTSDVTSDETFPRDPADPLSSPDRLPRSPAALRAALLGPDADCGGMEAYCLFESIRTLNLGFVLEPELEAGLIRSLVGASDIAYAGTSRDRLDRDVEVFAIPDPDGQRQHLLLLDTRTGFYLGDETVLLAAQPDLPDIDVPAVVEFAAVVERSRTTSTAGLP